MDRHDDHRTTRRGFMKLAGAASLALMHTPAPAAQNNLRSGFEVSASLYAWDLHDEGIEKILDNLQQMAGVNSVYLIALMHYEKRPLTSPVFPHNPARKTWQAEDSRVYWHPDPTHYGRIKPRLSDHDWLSQTDWLKVLTEAARKRGLKTGVELSHTVLDLDRIQGEFIDCAQRDINGQPRTVYGRGYPICLNNPDARQYVLNLFTELTARYDVDYVQTCTIPFMPGGPEKGGCFCPACLKAARENGVDLARIKAALKADPKAEAELRQWQDFRQASVARYYKLMHDGVHALKAGIDLRFNDCFKSGLDFGLKLERLKPHLDSVRVCDYTEQQGNPEAMKNKRAWLAAERKALGGEFPALSAVAVRPKATPALIREGVKIAIASGMDGITLGHYDGAEFPMLRAIREGLGEMGVSVNPAPAKQG